MVFKIIKTKKMKNKKKKDKAFRKVQVDSGFRWVFYSIISYILLIPLTITFKLWIPIIGISLVTGLLFWLLNEIITFQRIQIGQRFPGYPPYDKEDKPDELIKG